MGTKHSSNWIEVLQMIEVPAASIHQVEWYNSPIGAFLSKGFEGRNNIKVEKKLLPETPSWQINEPTVVSSTKYKIKNTLIW